MAVGGLPKNNALQRYVVPKTGWCLQASYWGRLSPFPLASLQPIWLGLPFLTTSGPGRHRLAAGVGRR